MASDQTLGDVPLQRSVGTALPAPFQVGLSFNRGDGDAGDRMSGGDDDAERKRRNMMRIMRRSRRLKADTAPSCKEGLRFSERWGLAYLTLASEACAGDAPSSTHLLSPRPWTAKRKSRVAE